MAPATTYTFSTIRNKPNLLKRCDGSNTTVPLNNSFADPDAVKDLIARKTLDSTSFILRKTGKKNAFKYHILTKDTAESSFSAQAPAPIQPSSASSGSVVRQVSPTRAPSQVGLTIGQTIQGQDCSDTAVVDRSGTVKTQSRHFLCLSSSVKGVKVLVVIALCGPTWEWMRASVPTNASYRLARSATSFALTWTYGSRDILLKLVLHWQADKSRYIEVVTLDSVALWTDPVRSGDPTAVWDDKAQYSFVTNVISITFPHKWSGPWRIEVQLKQHEMAKIYEWFKSTGGLHNQRYRTILVVKGVSTKVVTLLSEAPDGQTLDIEDVRWDNRTKRYVST